MIDTKLILNFWFLKCTPKMWFKKNYEFDELIKIKFSDIIERALKIDIDDIIISSFNIFGKFFRQICGGF